MVFFDRDLDVYAFYFNCPMCTETAIMEFEANVWNAKGCLMEKSIDVSDNPSIGPYTMLRENKTKCRCGHVTGTENARDTGEYPARLALN